MNTQTWLDTNDSSLNLGDFETPRHLCLENTIRIVGRSHLSDVVQVLLSITTERILSTIRIVEVNVLVVLALGFGVFVELPQRINASLAKQLVICCVAPGVVVQNLYRGNTGSAWNNRGAGGERWKLDWVHTEEILVISVQAQYVASLLRTLLPEDLGPRLNHSVNGPVFALGLRFEHLDLGVVDLNSSGEDLCIILVRAGEEDITRDLLSGDRFWDLC